MRALTTLEELEQNALAELGPMNSGSYADFMARASQEVSDRGVQRPTLMLGVSYRDDKVQLVGVKETPYPITEEEWDLFVGQADEYFDFVPAVYVVDGDRFTA